MRILVIYAPLAETPLPADVALRFARASRGLIICDHPISCCVGVSMTPTP